MPIVAEMFLDCGNGVFGGYAEPMPSGLPQRGGRRQAMLGVEVAETRHQQVQVEVVHRSHPQPASGLPNTSENRPAGVAGTGCSTSAAAGADSSTSSASVAIISPSLSSWTRRIPRALRDGSPARSSAMAVRAAATAWLTLSDDSSEAMRSSSSRARFSTSVAAALQSRSRSSALTSSVLKPGFAQHVARNKAPVLIRRRTQLGAVPLDDPGAICLNKLREIVAAGEVLALGICDRALHPGGKVRD